MKQTNNNKKQNSTKYVNRYVQKKFNSCTGNNSSPDTPHSTIPFNRPINNNNEIQQKTNQKTGKTTTTYTTKNYIQKIIQCKTNVHDIDQKLQCTENFYKNPNTNTNLQPVTKSLILNQHLNMSKSHTKEHNSIRRLFISTNSPIILDKTINNNNNIATKQTILDSKDKNSIQPSNKIKITDDINHNHNNIAKIKDY